MQQIINHDFFWWMKCKKFYFSVKPGTVRFYLNNEKRPRVADVHKYY